MQTDTHNHHKNWVWEVVCISFFLLLALAYASGRIGLHFYDHLLSSSDAANIASFSAALDHPQLFSNDALLNNPGNFAFYNTLHIPLIRLLAKWFGNYSTPFAFLIFPVAFLHLLGFYWLGREVLKDRWLSFMFSLAVLIPVRLNLAEIWGLWQDVIPRFLFQSLLPFLLAAALHWGGKPKSWSWLMAVLGLLVYIHPVSLPAWGLALFFSFWFLAPAMPLKQKLLRLLLAGILFLLVIMPFTFNYLSTTTFGTRGSMPYAELMEIIRKRFIPGFLDLTFAFKEFIKIVVISDLLMASLWGITLIGGIFLFFTQKRIKDPILLSLISWWAAVFIVSVVLPVMDHALAYRMQRLPYQFDLVRNLRFSIPLLLLSFFYLLVQFRSFLSSRSSEKKRVISFSSAALGLMLLMGWMARNDFFHNSAFLQTARCWTAGTLVCPFTDEKKINDQVGLLKAVKELTPPGSRILAAADTSELMIRYYSLRPLVYSYKDGGAFIYASLDGLRVWWQQYRAMSRILALDTRKALMDGLDGFAREYDAAFLVLEEKYAPQQYYPDGLTNIYSNEGFSLFQLTG